jgi:hypothetical protein
VAGVIMVGLTLTTYVATWTSWFISDGAYARSWDVTATATALGGSERRLAPGDTAQFTVFVHSQWWEPVTDVVVTVEVPDHLTDVSVTPTPADDGTFPTGTISLTVGDLAGNPKQAGDTPSESPRSMSFTLTGTVTGDPGASFTPDELTPHLTVTYAEQRTGWTLAVSRLWQYHQETWEFHNTLDAEHKYQSHPAGWIVQWRPVSFWFPSEVSELTGAEAQAACGSDRCVQPITSLGNPLIWWLGAAGIIVALVWLLVYRDWRAGAVLSGLLAGWVPWFGYAHRTIFQFYSVAFVPWVVLTLTYVIGLLIGPKDEVDPRTRRLTIRIVTGVVLLIIAVSAFYYPIWTAQTVSHDFWRMHMWLPRWI